jgi:CBS domain-containing protein
MIYRPGMTNIKDTDANATILALSLMRSQKHGASATAIRGAVFAGFPASRLRRAGRPYVQGVDMNVGEICSRIVVVAESSMPVQQAAKLMRDHHVGALVVTEGGAEARRPIGIVTDRDMVVEVVAADLDYRSLTVGDIMSERPATIKETAGLFETAVQMRSGGVRRLVVVDANEHLLGIVAMDDLIPVLAEELSALAQAVRMEQRREAQRRR